MNMVDRATRLVRDGFAVFPLHTIDKGSCTCNSPTCTSPAKHPIASLTPNGVKNATLDSGQVIQWWAEWPDANIAIATGEISDIVVIDIDDNDIWINLQNQHGDIPHTRMAETGGGGFHFHFAYTGNIRNQVGMLPGIDVRSDGGYIVAPPSLHASGERYQWVKGHSPKAVEYPAMMPDWLAEIVTGSPANKPRRAAAVIGTISEGGRNNTLASLAGTMRRRGMEEDEILAALHVVNVKRCDPPLIGREVEKIAWSVARMEPASAEMQVLNLKPRSRDE